MWFRRIVIAALPLLMGGCATFFTVIEEVGTAMLQELVHDGSGGGYGNKSRGPRHAGRPPCHPRPGRHR